MIRPSRAEVGGWSAHEPVGPTNDRRRGLRGIATIPPLMNTTTLRENWNGHPVEVGIAWTLKKRDHVAQCVLFSHQFGWELRLDVGELFKTQVCRST